VQGDTIERREGGGALDPPPLMVDEIAPPRHGSPWEVFGVALRLGVTSFGGPIAHLGYFRTEYVQRRQWLDEQAFGDLVGLCQFLPGPASSEVGIAIGITRAGLLGGLAAWLGFTMPSALALIAFGYGVQHITVANAGWIHGLLIVAVAVVANAVWGMARQFCPDRKRQTMAILATLVMLTWQTGLAQVLLIVVAGLVGWRIIEPGGAASGAPMREPIPRRVGMAALALFAALLVGLPILRQIIGNYTLALFTSFYRVGSLVFGGGHVVLPLLQSAVVPPGWVSNTQFFAGYGAAQAVPGPLFTFSAYLGTVAQPSPHGWVGGLIALAGIFLPAFLLVIGVMPFWNLIRVRPAFQSALRGINAAVVGLLLAALYNPVWTSAIKGRADFGLVVVAYGLLALWKLPPWVVVVVGAIGGTLIQSLS
jgi:chromate transporter